MAEEDRNPGTGLGAAPESAGVPQWVPWGVLAALAVLFCWQLFQVVVGGLLGAREYTLGRQLATAAISDGMAVVLVWGLVALWAEGKGRAGHFLGFRRPAWGTLRRALKPVAIGAAAYVGVQGAIVMIVSEIGESVPMQPLADLVKHEHSASLVASALIVGAVVAPVTEETIFRSLLYLPLRSRLGVVPAALIVSGLFALVHLYAWGTPQFVVLSLTFVALFERTGTLWAPIIAHGLYNGLMMLTLRSLAV